MKQERGPDPSIDADRLTGTTAPESGPEGSNVVGRPPGARTGPAFHEKEETPAEERRPFSPEEALAEGGSFDAVAPPETGAGEAAPVRT